MLIFEKCVEVLEGNSSAIAGCPVSDVFVGGVLGGLIAFGILIAIIAIAAFYVYHALAWMTITRKLKYKDPWFAWVPFLSTAMRLQLGGFHWAWTFLYLLPVIGWIALWVLLIISHWRIFEKRKHPGWFSLSIIIPKVGGILYLVAIGLVAWQDKKKR